LLETVKTFASLSEEFVELYLKHHPVAATMVGLHDYDHRLPDDSPDGFRERSSWLRDLEQRLVTSVPWQELPVEQRVDFGLLRSRIATLRAELEEIRLFTRNPSQYPETALTGIFLLLARPFAPLEERKEAILDRMHAVAPYLEAARANLEQVPDVFLGIASEINLGGLAFVDEVVRSLLRAFPGEAERIEHAGERARAGFLQYQEFLDRDLNARVGGTIALGERWMNFKLEREHMLAFDCAKLAALGEEHVALAHERLEQEAKRLDPAKTWREQIAAAALRHPEPLRVREAYQAEVERAARFVVEHKLVPFVEDAKLEIIDTPVFERATIPYASYLPPAPFDEERTGYFWVTPIDTSKRKDDPEQQLAGHHYAGLPLTTVHETYPGHHLQLSHAARAGSRLRRLANSDLFIEGWAFYCEELMGEQGFYLDPLTRLCHLRDLLWRACRVVVDVGIHTGRMPFLQAVDYLVEQVMLDRDDALAEVKRYALTPTQPMSYLVGKLEIVAMRDEAQKRLRGGFNLHAFHGALLACGSLQPALAREELWARLS
jgi:Bacterial protein of unknown function (DUF885)